MLTAVTGTENHVRRNRAAWDRYYCPGLLPLSNLKLRPSRNYAYT
jgi:hypothetical protein